MNDPAPPVPTKMPVLFIGHGSPMNIVLENDFTRSLQALGAVLPRPKAILVVSAHWLTRGSRVACRRLPDQIFDFYGFPEELYSVTYLPPTAPELAASITKLGKHREIQCDFHWGIDHAAWAVLKHVYPLADIPVIELSIDLLEPPVVHVTIARDLAELRTQGVLILASGNIVHNLREIDFANIDAPAFDWAVEFDEHIKAALLARDNQTLVRYLDLGESARRSVPTTDHYLPLLYAAAMREPEDSLTWIYEGFQNASISMRSFMLRGA